MVENNPDSFVIDASYLLGWLIPDETVTDTSDIMEQYANGKLELFSTELLPFEIANGLRSATLQKRLTITQARMLLSSFLRLGIILEKIDISQVWKLSQKHFLTCYDASYLVLSLRKKLPLLTRDAALGKVI